MSNDGLCGNAGRAEGQLSPPPENFLIDFVDRTALLAPTSGLTNEDR